MSQRPKLGPALAGLLDGTRRVVRFVGYVATESAVTMCQRIRAHPSLVYDAQTPGVGRIGLSYEDAVGDGYLEVGYWQRARAWTQRAREALGLDASTFDRAIQELSASWPQGVELLQNASGQPAFVGLVRVLKEGAGTLPRVGRVEWQAPPGRLTVRPTAQLLVTIALSVPEEGGELLLWDVEPGREDYERLKIEDRDGLRRDRLPEPAMAVKPSRGELLVLDARKVHCVLPVVSGESVFLSFFLVFDESGAAFVFS